MNKASLLRIINALPDNADIEISVDISTNENNAYDRVFAHEVFAWQHNGKNSYTILATGSKNF